MTFLRRRVSSSAAGDSAASSGGRDRPAAIAAARLTIRSARSAPRSRRDRTFEADAIRAVRASPLGRTASRLMCAARRRRPGGHSVRRRPAAWPRAPRVIVECRPHGGSLVRAHLDGSLATRRAPMRRGFPGRTGAPSPGIGGFSARGGLLCARRRAHRLPLRDGHLSPLAGVHRADRGRVQLPPGAEHRAGRRRGPQHSRARALPPSFDIHEEFYVFDHDPRPHVHVLVRLDTSRGGPDRPLV